MADLIVNVWLRRHLYGPGNLPPEDLWSEVPAEAWDEVPEATAESPTGSLGAAQVGAGGDAPTTGSGEGDQPSLLDQLGRLPDDKDVLAGFAEAHGIDVDHRKGPAKLREDLQTALTERMP